MTAPDTLHSRTAFIGLDDEACHRLRHVQPLIASAIGPALDVFYGKVRNHEHTASFFRNDAHVAHAKSKQEEHWSVIASGKFGADYEQRVRAIGNTHARLGLEPRWYIGGYAIALEQLIGAVVSELWPSRWQVARTPDEMAKTLGVLVKAALLDMDLSISTYLEALDEKRRAAEEAQKSAQQAQQCALDALSVALAKLADGDLSNDLQAELAADFASLKANFNETVAKLRTALTGVQESAKTIAAGTQEISLAADDLSKRTEQQAASLEQTAAALDEITATVKRTAEGSQQAQSLVALAKENAEKAGDVVTRAVGAMGAIEKSSNQINQIIVVIDEIAFQTNLLALNAGVEAARAGEAGRGFAVVASEVRALAQRSAEAAKEIKSLLGASTAQVNAGVVLVAETGEALERIMKQVAQINGVVADIAAGAVEQATGLAEVNTAVNQMDQTTQQNAAMVEQTTAASYSLSEKTAELDRLISIFSLGRGTAAAPTASKPALRAPAAKTSRTGLRPGPGKSAGARMAAAPASAPAAAQEANWEDF